MVITPPEAWNAGEWFVVLTSFVLVMCGGVMLVDRAEAWWRRSRHTKRCELCSEQPARENDVLCLSCTAVFRVRPKARA